MLFDKTANHKPKPIAALWFIGALLANRRQSEKSMDAALQDYVLGFALADLPTCFAAFSLVSKRWHDMCCAALPRWCADNADLDERFAQHIPYVTAHSPPPDWDADEHEQKEYERRNHVCWQDIPIRQSGVLRVDSPILWVDLSASRPGRYRFRLCTWSNSFHHHCKVVGDAKALCSHNYWRRIPVSHVEQELAKFNPIFAEPWFGAWAFRVVALRKILRNQ